MTGLHNTYLIIIFSDVHICWMGRSINRDHRKQRLR